MDAQCWHRTRDKGPWWHFPHFLLRRGPKFQCYFPWESGEAGNQDKEVLIFTHPCSKICPHIHIFREVSFYLGPEKTDWGLGGQYVFAELIYNYIQGLGMESSRNITKESCRPSKKHTSQIKVLVGKYFLTLWANPPLDTHELIKIYHMWEAWLPNFSW